MEMLPTILHLITMMEQCLLTTTNSISMVGY